LTDAQLDDEGRETTGGIRMKNGFFLLTAFFFLPCAAMAQDYGLDSLLTYSLEELSNMPIYSASNVLERLSDAPALS
jgi:hypothetical protein